MHHRGLAFTTLAVVLGCGAPVETLGPTDPASAAPAIDDSPSAFLFNPGPPSPPPDPNPPGDGGDDDGDGPNIRLSEQGLYFGQVCSGDTAQRDLTIRNIGDGTLTISGLNVTGDGFDLVNAPTLPLRIAPGGRRTLRLQFDPTGDRVTPYEGNLRIHSNDPDQPSLNVPLGGLALPATVSVSPRQLSFGTVENGETVTRPVRLRNNGACPARIVRTRVSGSLSETISTGALPARIDRGETETVNVRMRCDGQDDSLEATLRFVDRAGRSVGSVLLTGACDD